MPVETRACICERVCVHAYVLRGGTLDQTGRACYSKNTESELIHIS